MSKPSSSMSLGVHGGQRASSTPATTTPTAPATSPASNGSEFDDLFARAQAMGLRLTREEYERTRAGVTAFLKAERLPTSPAVNSSNASTSMNRSSSASGACQVTPVPVTDATPSTSSAEGSRAAAPVTDSASQGQSQQQQQQQSRSQSQRAPGLSFFTAVVAPEPKPSRPKPRLDDVSSLEEKRRRRERRRRMRQKLATMSEPEATPRTSLAGSPLMSSSQKATSTYSGHSSGGSSRRRSGGTNSTTLASNLPVGAFATRTTASSPPVGLGLGISPGSSPLSAFPRRRASRRRASSANDALASSAELQAATGIASGDEEDLGGSHNHVLASRAWLSRSGALKLVTPAVSKAVDLQDAQVSATEDMDPDDSGIVVLSSPVRKQARDLCREVIASPLEVRTASGDGFENASRAGWGSRAHNELAAATSRPALLERVMKSKRSPRRLRTEAKERKRAAAIIGAGSPTRQRTLTDDEKAVLELAAEAKGASGSNSAELVSASEWTMPTASTTSQARQSALHPSLPINETQAVHRRDESSSHPRTESQSLHFRKATHSRQMSQAGKTVRWAPNVAASPVAHQRMTTRDHYEFFVHGIAPGQSGLGDLDVEQDITPSASAQDTMPWLFPSHAQSSPIRRRPSFVSDDLAIDLSSMIEGDFDDVSAADLFNPRRGLLFTGSGIIQQSPSQHRGSVSAGGSSWSTPGVRFNPGFSDPSLSQSPARPLLAHMASSPARFSFGSATKPHGYTGARLGSISGPGAAYQPARQLFAASPTNPRSRGMAGSLAHADTISPAAVFGGGGGVIPQQIPFVRPHLRLNSNAQAANGTMSQPLPEPTKHWGRISNDGGDADGEASIIGDANVSAAHLMGSPALRRDSSLRLMAGSDGVAQVVMVDAEPQFGGNVAGASLPSADKKSTAQESSTPSSAQSTKKKSKKASQAGASTTPSSQQSAPASSQPSHSDAAPASGQQLQSAQPPPNADMSQSEWTRDDGSKVVKLVSEELQAAIDAGSSSFKEPPPRYYVLPAGAGSTNAKPSHVSYAGLIGQAILTSSDGRLSLNEIYQWINTVHPYYERGDRGWQNSIRHNLSLNKSFMKVERDANFPGKGGWWAIKPGHEDRFHDGLYSAVPSKSSAGAAGVSAPVSGASASKKKKSSGPASSTDTPGDYSHDTGSSQWQSSPMPQPASMTQQGHPEATANRKRQTTGGEADSPLSSPSRQQGNDSRRKGSKSLKKPKLGAIGMSKTSSSGEGEDESFNVNNVARVPFASIGNRQQAVPTYHTVPYGGMLVSSTPHRPDQAPYMSSSTHGGSQSGGGMPMLTDSASSPPSSPPPMSDNAMPPPSSLGPMSSKKGRQHSGLNAAAMYGGANLMHYGGPGSSGVNHDGIMQHSYGVGAGNNPFYGGGGGGNGMFYATQPSPLANRLRGGHGANNSSTGGNGVNNGASPLRRQAIPTSSPGSPGKVASPPVSSVRDMSWSAQPGAGAASNASSSLAGALNLRGPVKSGKEGSVGANGGSRNTKRQRGGASNQVVAPQRGSPLRRSTGSPLRLQQHHSLNQQHQQPPSGQSSAGAQLQMAMQQGLSNGSNNATGEFGSMGPSLGGLGLGFTTNLTPSRVTPNAGGNKTMMHAISPSPTTRRFHQQQQASGWLEDPFNYQGALQHELDNMGGSGGSHGGHGSGGHGSNVLSMGSSGGNISGQSGQWGAVDMTLMRGGGSSWSSATAGMTPSTMESLSAVRGGREAGYHRAD